MWDLGAANLGLRLALLPTPCTDPGKLLIFVKQGCLGHGMSHEDCFNSESDWGPWPQRRTLVSFPLQAGTIRFAFYVRNEVECGSEQCVVISEVHYIARRFGGPEQPSNTFASQGSL